MPNIDLTADLAPAFTATSAFELSLLVAPDQVIDSVFRIILSVTPQWPEDVFHFAHGYFQLFDHFPVEPGDAAGNSIAWAGDEHDVVRLDFPGGFPSLPDGTVPYGWSSTPYTFKPFWTAQTTDDFSKLIGVEAFVSTRLRLGPVSPLVRGTRPSHALRSTHAYHAATRLPP